MMQISSMDRYDRLLIELGEKNYSTYGSSWPVEIRILLLALFNAALLIGVNMLTASSVQKSPRSCATSSCRS